MTQSSMIYEAISPRFQNVPKDGLIIGDLMCGGGGSSTGMMLFFDRVGLPIKRFVAIDNNPSAILCHEMNHPNAIHFCKDLDKVDLSEAFPEGYADFIWASPTCTQHSPARGGRPIVDEDRKGPWDILNLVKDIHVERMMVENVPEFTRWTVLDSRGRQIKSREGEIFREWKAAIEAVGYKFEWRITNAADFGAAMTRERFLAILTRKGRIYWAIPTHSETAVVDMFRGPTEKWRGARDDLDMTIPSSPIVGRKVPLAAPTLTRIWHGMRKQWGISATRAFSHDVRYACREGLDYNNSKILEAKESLSSSNLNARKKKLLTNRIKRMETGVQRYLALLSEITTFLDSTISSASLSCKPFVITLRGTGGSNLKSSATSLDKPSTGISATLHQGVVLPKIDTVDHNSTVAERLLAGEDGAHYIARVYFRMLHPQKELASLMGFPKTYKWPKSVSLTARLIGNACQVEWVYAHVSAQLGPVYIKDWDGRKYRESYGASKTINATATPAMDLDTSRQGVFKSA